MRIVIVGDGKIGSALAEQLSREGHEITIVDRSGAPLQRTVEDLDILSIEGNGATYATQLEAGVDEAELVIAVTAQDELNLLCCLVAKKIGAKHTIARVRNPEYAGELSLISDDLGLSLSVNPELICATEMARTLRIPSAIKTDTFFGGKVELRLELDDLRLTGFADKELDIFLQGAVADSEKDPDDAPPVPETPTCKLGDVWQLGIHRLMCGDSTKAADVVTLMSGEQADMVWTDPPYNVDYSSKAGKIKNDKM